MIDPLPSPSLQFDQSHQSQNKYNITPLKLLTPKNHPFLTHSHHNLTFLIKSKHLLQLMVNKTILLHLLDASHPSPSHVIHYLKYRQTSVLLCTPHCFNCSCKSTSPSYSCTAVKKNEFFFLDKINTFFHNISEELLIFFIWFLHILPSRPLYYDFYT